MSRRAAPFRPLTRLAVVLATSAALAAGAARADEALPAVARGALLPSLALHSDPNGGMERLLDAARVRGTLLAREERRLTLRWVPSLAELPSARAAAAAGNPSVAAIASNTLERGAIGPATVLLPAFVARVVARLGVASSLLLSRPARAAAAGHEMPAGLALAKKLP